MFLDKIRVAARERLEFSDVRMLCKSKMQPSAPKKSQIYQWENQNQFLQDRHGHKKEAPSETILVAVRRDEQGFELLSWAVNIAARPGDSVIAFHLGDNGSKVENIIAKLQNEIVQEQEAAKEQLKALKDICNLKQVQLDLRFAISGNEKLELIQEASSAHATMLVVSPTIRHGLRNSHRSGRWLARQIPAGCSLVVVKNYKVLFYKENALKEAKEDSVPFSEESHHMAHTRRSRSTGQQFGKLQRQFSCKSGLLWRDTEDLCDLDTKVVTGSKVWPVQAGEHSPRTVLDGPSFSESDGISPSSSFSALSRSLSRKGLLSCVSPQERGHVLSRESSHNCLGVWRNGSIRRSSTFPPTSRFKSFSGPLQSSSMRSSFKSYVNTLWGSGSVDLDASCTSPFLSEVQQAWRCFSYEEIACATDDFNPDNMVGKGGHAEVYKGSLNDGRLVAIKRLLRIDSGEQNERDFLIELGIIGHVCHPNTTPLVGFCVEKDLHLIFHLSSHGSLATQLHGFNRPVLDWAVRYKVAVGIARGLHYLHTACQRRIIHRDIKASNILLGPDFEPQISDFGLAKWLPEQCAQLSVFPVEGTFGYLAPEYFMHGIVHEKTDVFAYGVLLLELITGRLPIDNSQKSLVIWAKPLLESSRIEDLVDPRLDGAYDLREMQCMVTAAGLCVQHSPVCRPYIGQVLELLAKDNLDSDTNGSHCMPSSQSNYYQDSLCTDEYSSSTYLSDLSRHREVALQF